MDLEDQTVAALLNALRLQRMHIDRLTAEIRALKGLGENVPELDIRVQNCLQELGFWPANEHIDEIAAHSEAFWRRQPNIGVKSWENLREWLAFHGVYGGLKT